MEFSAIFHDTTKKYCYALEKGYFVIRLKTKRNDIKRVTLLYQDKYIPINFHDTRASKEMHKIASDNYCDYYEVRLEMDMVCLRYQFELEDYEGQIYYYANHEFYKEPRTHIDYMYDCPQNLREEEMVVTPEWAKNKVVYQIFPSRFATSQDVREEDWYQAPIGHQADLKGDLRGIINHLEHLVELGVDIIYMTPIFQSPSSHKYNTVDYYKIDPSFGTEEDIKELVDKAHALEMYVIMDAVFNHTGTDFFAFQDVLEKQADSRYVDWYYIDCFPLDMQWGKKPNFKTFSYFPGMPKLNLQNDEVAEYCIGVGRYWMEKCHIDGWRLDVGDEVSHKFWRRFRKAIKEVNPEALIIGEVWHHAEDFLDGEEWDTVMNYPFCFAMENLVANESITASQFLGQMGYLEGNLHSRIYPLLWNLIDSHDFSRFMYRCGEDVERFKLGVGLQLLWPGMPFVYYGDEYGMTGGADPDCRRGMVWDEKYQNQEIYEWYRKLIRIRKEYPVLTEGRTTNVFCDDEQGVFAITKEKDGQEMILLAHVKAGAAIIADETISSKLEGTYNLLSKTAFSKNLADFELAVLIKK
ncbi:MAG: alpha-glycosidase [Agathobacter sp.]|nr:alpha-glycosidase [Agathobacter sp.]